MSDLDTNLVCSGCGEPVQDVPPAANEPAWGWGHAHLDGTDLCHGASPVDPATYYDDGDEDFYDDGEVWG